MCFLQPSTGASLHQPLFAKLWCEMRQSTNVDRRFLTILLDSPLLLDYINCVLMEERASLSSTHIYAFFTAFFPKLSEQVQQEHADTWWENILQSLANNRQCLEKATSMSERTVNKILYRLNGVGMGNWL